MHPSDRASSYRAPHPALRAAGQRQPCCQCRPRTGSAWRSRAHAAGRAERHRRSTASSRARVSLLRLADVRYRGLRAGRDTAQSADADRDQDRHVMSRHRRSQLRVHQRRWLGAGIDPVCAASSKQRSETPSRAVAKAGRPRAMRSDVRSRSIRSAPPVLLPDAGRRASRKSP